MPKLTLKPVSTTLVSAGVISLLLAIMGSSTVHAEFDQADDPDSPFAEWGYMKDDWQLVCDNTLTCRAAGYTDDMTRSENNRAASLLLSIKAGEKTAIGQVQLNNWEDAEQEKLVNEQLAKTDFMVELLLNGRSHGIIQLSADRMGKLSQSQTQQLVKSARQNTSIKFKSGDLFWQVSDVGMAAVLLKLDEVQGRVGSPLALVSKNSTTRQPLKPAKSIPKIYAVAPYPISEYASAEEKGSDEQKYYQQLSERYSEQWQDKMSAWVAASLSESDKDTCNILTSDTPWVDEKDKIWRFMPIDAKHTLASFPCWRAAYNTGTGYWLIANDYPSKPMLITASGSEYGNGEIFSAQKGRGLGDCWSTQSWVWDGKTFAKTLEQSTGMCRGIQAGGAWNMLTYVSEVIQPNKSTR